MKQIIIVVLFSILSVGTAQAWILDLLASPFRTTEAAPYEVVRTLPKGVEERTYPAKKWATTEKVMTEKAMNSIRREMFMSLFGYITGENQGNTKIPMTVPVATKVEKSQDGKTSYQMGFFVPEEFQSNTPVPSSPKVKIVERNLHVYSITFGGYADESDYEEQLLELKAILHRENITVPAQPATGEPLVYYSGYDSPAKFWSRRNEVWMKV